MRPDGVIVCYSYHIGMRLDGLQHMPSVFLGRFFGNFYADISFPNSPFLSAAFTIKALRRIAAHRRQIN
jgi:hypothetical protein